MGKQPTWHDKVFFGLHFDLHAGAHDTELGGDLTPEHLAERLARVRPDWVQCDCKGHAGYTSWPTKVGSPSPGIVRDALRIHREVTREMGIPLVMHYSGVWDTRAIELHPEWATIGADGQPSPHMTCRLGGYRAELMIPQMLELVRDYQVDGIWVDGENWASYPCWCRRCRTAWADRSGGVEAPRNKDDAGWFEWLAMHRELFVRHVSEYTDAIHAANPSCTVCSNWMYTVRQPDAVEAPVDYLSGDYDWIWSTDRAAVEGRVLDGRGLSWDLMAWGFSKTADMGDPMPWCTKPAVHLCAEAAEVVALGGAVQIYNTPQRSGRLSAWMMDTMGEVASFCRERRDPCWHSTSRSQVVVLHLPGSFYRGNDPLFNYGSAAQPLEGALHALLETGRSTDILTSTASLLAEPRYRLAVLPEPITVSAEEQGELLNWVRSGGHLILSGSELDGQASDLVSLRKDGDSIDSGYLMVAHRTAPVWGGWQPVSTDGAWQPLAGLLPVPDPEVRVEGRCVLVRRQLGEGTITALLGPFFRNYFAAHYPLSRAWFSNLVGGLPIEWEVELGAPAQVELIVRTQGRNMAINLLNRGAGEMLMPRRVMVDELLPLRELTLRVRCPEPSAVIAVPALPQPTWTWSDGVLDIQLAQLDVHAVITVMP